MQDKLQKIAKLSEDDTNDMRSAIADIMTNSKVDFKTAKTIALALRQKYLPKVAEAEFQLDVQDILGLLSKDFSDLSPTNSMENECEDSDENEFSKEGENVKVDRDEDSIAKIELMVPESKLDEIQQAMEEALNDSSFTEYVNIDHDFDESESDHEAIEANNDEEDDNTNEDLQSKIQRTKKANNDRGEIKMTRKELMQRKAERENIVSEAEMVLNDSKVPFDHSAKGQPNQMRKWPKTKLEDDGDNSLKKDTEEWLDTEAKSKIPTLNKMEMFRNQENIEAFTFDSTPSGGLKYTLDPSFFDGLHNIPTEGGLIGEDTDYKVPTQMNRENDLGRRTIVLASDEGDEDGDFGGQSYGLGDDGSDDSDEEFDGNMFDDESEDSSHEEEEEGAEKVFEDFEGLSKEDKMAFMSQLKDWAKGPSMDKPSEKSPMENPTENSDSDFDSSADESPMTPMDKKEAIASVLGPNFDLENAEEVLYYVLKTAKVSDKDINKLTFAEGINLANKIIKAQAANGTEVPVSLKVQLADSGMDADDTDDFGDDLDAWLQSPDSSDSEDDDFGMNSEPDDLTMAKSQFEKQAQLREMRMRTAYNVWTQLALYGEIEPDAVADHVNNWLEEGLSVKAMISQGDVMVKMAQTKSSAVRKASANSNNLTTRNTVSTTPAFYSGIPAKAPAVMDLTDALSGLFTRKGIDPDLNK